MTADTPTSTALPGKPIAYPLKGGTGRAYVLGGQVNRFLATCDETDGTMAVANNIGPPGVKVPPHRHQLQHDLLYCVRGRLQVWANEESWMLHAGDLASLPPGTVHSFEILGHYTELLSPVVPCRWPRFFEIMASPFGDGVYPPTDSGGPPSPEKLAQVEEEELSHAVPEYTFHDADLNAAGNSIPDDERPYFLRAGEGPRHLFLGQVCFQIVPGSQTRGRVGMTIVEGSAGRTMPLHLHEGTQETIFCLDGRMRVWTDGEQHDLTQGDFVSIPKGVKHAYSLDSSLTRFASMVAPAGIERLHEIAGSVAEYQIFPREAESAEPEQLERAAREIDITFLD